MAARRQLVETLFNPLDEKGLNADELRERIEAATKGLTEATEK